MITATTPREQARPIVQLVFTTLARAIEERFHPHTPDLFAHHTDRATGAARNIDRVFWTLSAVDVILAADADEPKRAEWARYAAARIGLATHLSQHDRANMTCLLTRRVLPVT